MSAVVLLSLCSAITYGVSDFVGGLLTRRASVFAVAGLSQATATVVAVGFAAMNVGQFDTRDLLWGMLAGVGAGAGNVFIYRGLAIGRMTVVAPLSAIATAALPLLVGFAAGERPGVLPLTGVAIALPAIWLVSGGGWDLRGVNRADVSHGLLAGGGFGVQLSALGQISSAAGLMPLVVSQATSVATIVAAATALSEPWVPRDRYSRLAVVAGVFAGGATICFQLAVQHGLLTIATVITSLYPAVTVLLAAMLLRERIHGAQGLGLTLAAAAVALIASG